MALICFLVICTADTSRVKSLYPNLAPKILSRSCRAMPRWWCRMLYHCQTVELRMKPYLEGHSYRHRTKTDPRLRVGAHSRCNSYRFGPQHPSPFIQTMIFWWGGHHKGHGLEHISYRHFVSKTSKNVGFSLNNMCKTNLHGWPINGWLFIVNTAL